MSYAEVAHQVHQIHSTRTSLSVPFGREELKQVSRETFRSCAASLHALWIKSKSAWDSRELSWVSSEDPGEVALAPTDAGIKELRITTSKENAIMKYIHHIQNLLVCCEGHHFLPGWSGEWDYHLQNSPCEKAIFSSPFFAARMCGWLSNAHAHVVLQALWAFKV